MNTARHTVTDQAAVAAIEQGARMLRLPTIRDRFAESPPQPNVNNSPIWGSYRS